MLRKPVPMVAILGGKPCERNKPEMSRRTAVNLPKRLGTANWPGIEKLLEPDLLNHDSVEAESLQQGHRAGLDQRSVRQGPRRRRINPALAQPIIAAPGKVLFDASPIPPGQRD